MERKYDSNEAALNVAKEAVWLAWNACGGPAGMGFMQDRGPNQDRDTVWKHAYDQRDYTMRHGPAEQVSCDYVMGRMMKLTFTIKDGTIKHNDYEPRRDYQSWCGKYPTFAALFDAAEAALQKQAA